MPAGARPGERRGGKKKGSATTKTREIADRAIAQGLTPLEYLLEVMRDEDEVRSVRLEAAKAAAPYIHPRLANEQVTHAGEVAITKIEHVICHQYAKPKR